MEVTLELVLSRMQNNEKDKNAAFKLVYENPANPGQYLITDR